MRPFSAGGRTPNLNEAVLSWRSHALLSEILWREANTTEQKKFAAFVERQTEWCYAEFLEYGETCPEVAWAIDVLRPWVRNGDGAPKILREKQENRR